jgi:trans-aconitate methyltransferase
MDPSSSDAAKRRQGYQKSFAKHGARPQAMQWKDYPAAAQRFVQLAADLPIAHKSILDVGCGMGDLLPYLYAKAAGQPFTYHGVDITPEFIEVARQRFAGHEFSVGNPFETMPAGTFDIIVASGIMNADQPDWLTQRKHMIKQLFDQAHECLAFNMAGWTGAAESHGHVAYADSQAITRFCQKLTPDMIVRQHYHAKDFTVILFKR